MRNKKIVLIGGAGFIGLHLLQKLDAEACFDLTLIDRDFRKIQSSISEKSSRIKFVQGRYEELDALENYIAEADVVVSLAAICNPDLYLKTPIDVIESNYDEPVKLLKLCVKHKKWLIHFSTSEVVGKTIQRQFKESFPKSRALSSEQNDQKINEYTPYVLGPLFESRWCYASAKQLLERKIFAYGQTANLPWTIIRPFNFIGPKMDYMPGIDGEGTPRVLANFMSCLFKNKPLPLVDGGLNKRVFTDVRDAVDALCLIIKNRELALQKIYHLGNPDNECTIVELAEKLIQVYQKEYQKSGALINVDSQEFYGIGYGDSDRRLPDIRNLQEDFQWEPKFSLEESLSFALHAFQEEYSDYV